jgi:integrase
LTTTKRRSPGEGGASSYKTLDGLRWKWKASLVGPDGVVKVRTKSGFATKKAALDDLNEARASAKKGELVEPSKLPFGAYAREAIDGMRLRPSARASYLKNLRLHIEPYPIANLTLAQLTGSRLTAHYRTLEKSGRRDWKGGGLGPRTVRYIHQMIHGILRQAIKDGLLIKNPADVATPPTADEAAAPEMHPWIAPELRAFLTWSRDNSEMHPAWYVLAMTGCRRGELLALRWSDIDLDAATVSFQRSATLIRNKGVGAEIVIGPPKTKKSRRVIDIDPATVAVLREHKKARGSLALALARPEALVFGTLDNEVRHPERFSRLWNQTVARAIKADIDVPQIRLHDLRHTHATALLKAGEPVKVVSERLGHGSAMVTITVYGHVMPGDQKRAASRFADLVAMGS